MSYRKCPTCDRWLVGDAFAPKRSRCRDCDRPDEGESPLLGTWRDGPTRTVDRTIPSNPEYPKGANE